MTTLTQARLDDMRKNAEKYPDAAFYSYEILTLLDRIAELEAERDEARHQLDGAREEITCAHLRLDRLGAPRDDRDTALFLPQRIAELEAQASATTLDEKIASLPKDMQDEIASGTAQLIEQERKRQARIDRASPILAEAALKGEGE